MTSTTPSQQNGGVKSKIDSQNTSNNTSPQTYFKPSSLLYNAANNLGHSIGNGSATTGSALPNGYATASAATATTTGNNVGKPKVATLSKQDIDYHLENFIMNRKIALNGGNELRIDEKNISLHLNNPFVGYAGGGNGTAGMPTSTSYNTLGRASMRSYLEENSNGSSSNSSTLTRPNRPHSIAVSSPLMTSSHSNNDLKASIYQNPSVLFNSPSMRQANHQYYAPQSPANTLQKNQQMQQQQPQPQQQQNQPKIQPTPPAVPARRSQSIPRQTINQQLPSNGSMTVSRPRSLDRCNGISSQPPPVAARRMVQSHYANPAISRVNVPIGGMRQSQTFHGQPLRSDMYQFPVNDDATNVAGPSLTNEGENMKRNERPMSFAYGTVPEQVYLEHQLRLYTDQLRTITEGVRRYSEQTRLLQEMKRQRQHEQQQHTPKMTNSRSEPRLKQPDLKLGPPPDDAQTPSHQLKLFLDSIRSSMREPSDDQAPVQEDDEGESEDEDSQRSNAKGNKVPSPAPPHHDPKTPSDQLRQFLDAIRSNQEPPKPSSHYANPSDIMPKVTTANVPGLGSANSLRPKLKELQNLSHSPNTTESFSKVTDNINIMNQQLEHLSTTTATATSLANLRTTKYNMDQVLDNFYQMASHLKTTNSVEYLRKCQEVLKQTTEQIRYLNAQKYANSAGVNNAGANINTNGNGNNNNSGNFYDSHDDSSCSTTPGSIREAVQHLLAQPRNGFQIMDDRMKVFIDIIEAQEKFSQVSRFSFCLLVTLKRPVSLSWDDPVKLQTFMTKLV